MYKINNSILYKDYLFVYSIITQQSNSVFVTLFLGKYFPVAIIFIDSIFSPNAYKITFDFINLILPILTIYII